MINVVEVDLGRLGVRLPRGDVGVVMAQPFLSFTKAEPFTLTEETRLQALESIDKTLSVAQRRRHGLDKTHFTIFPECSIPGLEGVSHVTEALAKPEWPTETIVIGGVDGLTRAQFFELVRSPGTTYDNAENDVERIGDDQWVNCSVTWVKLPEGEVRRWVQPKLEPAWVEVRVPSQSMFRGKSIFLFKGIFADSTAPYQFSTLLCFDWIGSEGNRRIWQWLLQGINDTAVKKDAVLPLTWLFVAQCNPAPSHGSFMGQVGPFYDHTQFHNVNRAATCLIMANVAGSKSVGKAAEYGRSAVIFSPDKLDKPDCMPTFCNGGERHRPGNPLENLRDAVFRERGACIHSFIARNPDALPPGSAGRRYAIAEATVHPLHHISDPRAPGGHVPAVVKWVNDDLDDATKSLATLFATPLVTPVAEAHQKSVSTIRKTLPERLSTTVLVASSVTTNRNPDTWSEPESKALTHLLRTLSILEASQYPPEFHGNSAHATITKGDEHIEVVAVTGRTHEDCDRHIIARAISRRGPLLMVSRDEENTHWNNRMNSIFEQATSTAKEYSITDPNSAVIRVGYQDILNAYRNAADGADLKGAIDAALS